MTPLQSRALARETAPCYYFGAWSHSSNLGHCLYRPGGATAHDGEVPFSPWLLDSGFIPHERHESKCQDGIAHIHRVDGWTLVAFWDQSADSRAASNSVFLVPGSHTVGEVMEMAAAHFPEIVNRKGFPIARKAVAL